MEKEFSLKLKKVRYITRTILVILASVSIILACLKFCPRILVLFSIPFFVIKIALISLSVLAGVLALILFCFLQTIRCPICHRTIGFYMITKSNITFFHCPDCEKEAKPAEEK